MENSLAGGEMQQQIGILGCGYSVPPHIRRNDDPIFNQVKGTVNSRGIAEKDLFTGMRERRYLDGDEQLETLMVEAAQIALNRANLLPADIDRLYGYATVSPYITPNALYAVHRGLKLSEQTLVVPVNNEFTNFLLSVLQAWEAIAAGHCTYALIVCGTNWTKFMDYTQGHALSVGDGAGAVVLGPNAPFALVDYATQTLSEQYGAMTMQTRVISSHGQRHLLVDENNVPIPTYEITLEEGIRSFQVSGMYGLPQMVNALLKKYDLSGKDIALITHQASRVLMDQWASSIQPKEYLDTFEQFGNLTLATYPVNLAYHYHSITAGYLVFAAVGVGYHQTALLLKRY
ncbi:3-oxoacyl-ACP synthase [Ktedonosporobacter rubrisoli]|uniref:3-oxoacyl-ACP synthase n=1 Tax=Ktedonosporobacter rubrisoli TaxID=2509675 RepID=A0A4V0YZU5_KTERU|nr:3-oxoacyl-[acyl-carrier-protein] synthase III C-terminal domain-containing protein [Ktedonosporobacter rubrisoli]QBD80941.1 3-oxoacyl-ACP synthase [Ktedonosporobacter rubrisoli]